MRQALTRQILDYLTTSILWFDKDLYLLDINPAAEDLLALSGRKIIGQHVSVLCPQEGPFVEALRRSIKEHIPITEYEVELFLTHGRFINVDYTMTPISAERKTLRILVEMVNIGHHLRMAREEAQAQQQMATQTLLRGLAHEIRNPLGGLRGAAQLLAKQLGDKNLCEYTDIIIDEADRLQSLLDQLLGPRTLPSKNRINIHQTLLRVSQLIEHETSQHVCVKKDFDPSLPDIVIDPDQLLQAVLNIMRNAVQAMDGKGKIHLRTRIRRKMTLAQQHHRLVVQIDIEDNGPGIDPALREQIFYPMITGRPNGTGLGLSIAQNLISRHQGLVGFDSEPGKTVFSIWLPVNEGGTHE
jgi:two-component system nitrogen regulation sensor histidine kinase GlnL